MNRKIVLSVTTDKSITLLDSFPDYLNKRGWKVHLVCSPGNHLNEFRLKNPKIQIHEIYMKRNPSPINDFLSFYKWIKLLKKIKPDIVSPATPKAGMLGITSAFFLRIPHRIYNLWGLKYETSGKLLCNIFKIIEKFVSYESTIILSASKSLSDKYIEDKIAPKEKIIEIGLGSTNGVDIEFFHPKYKCIKSNKKELERIIKKCKKKQNFNAKIPVIVFSARLVVDKGINELYKAINFLSSKEIKFQLLIIGGLDSTNSLDIEAVRNIESLQDSMPIFFTGHINDRYLYRSFLSLADIFCLPTYREGFPNVVLEAGAMGIPTITTNATGAINSVVNNETGIIVKSKDYISLAKALESLILNPQNRELMGNNARKWIIDNFERNKFQKKMLEFFLKLH